jgi:hypothetical protein
MTMTKKVKSFKHDRPDARLIERSVVIREGSQDEANKSFTAVIASENPVARWDETRQEVVQEILLMSGLQYRDGRNQLPIVDSHDRSTTRNVLGSIRNIQIINGECEGVPMFARDTDSQDAYYKVLDGHITDFSITADCLEIAEVKRGQVAVFEGREIQGPANVVTKWQPTDASLVAAGADVRSKVRRSYELSKGIARAMTPEAIAQLVAKGMPSDLTDPDQIMAWVLGNLSASNGESTEGVVEMQAADAVAPMPDAAAEEDKPKEEVAMERAKIDTDSIVLAERKRALEISALCTKAGIERTIADQWTRDGVSLEVVREKVIERMAANAATVGTSVGADVRVTESGDDKFYGAIRDGLLMRSQRSARVSRILVGATPSPGAEEFQHMSLMRMAEEILRRGNVATHRFSSPEIARAAMGNRTILERMGVRRDYAYHTTGTFTNLLQDASNKSLLAAYEEAPYTWELWARRAASVDDFKNVNRMRFSESPDLEEVPENADYPEGVMSDSKESYKVAKFGKMFSVSWETIVNDDLDAISRVPAMHGNAARRTQNRKVYEVLTSNPTMGDGVALFGAHTSGTNTSGAAAAPSVTTLNTGFAAMRTQKGLNSTVTINVVPRYLIVPVNYEATALELINSISYNAANNNEGVKNIYGPGGPRSVSVIGEPVLDAASTTVWYLAADPGQIDTVELAFLAGEESPVMETEWVFDNDTYKQKIRQTFGVKAIDWRGLWRNAA